MENLNNPVEEEKIDAPVEIFLPQLYYIIIN